MPLELEKLTHESRLIGYFCLEYVVNYWFDQGQ
jgi:hypothetical protein